MMLKENCEIKFQKQIVERVLNDAEKNSKN